MNTLARERIVDPVLTNLAIGYSNVALVAHNLFPFVNVDKEAGKLPKFGKDSFLVYDTERALRAESNRGDLDTPTTDSFLLTEHDLEFAVDDREETESVFSARRRAMVRSTEAIRLKHEVQVAGIVLNAANYASTNKVALSGSTSFANANSDPEGVIDDAKAAISAGIVKDANTMVIGYDAWRSLKRHPKLKAILSDSRSRLVMMDDLREIFEIPNIVIGRAMSKAKLPTPPPASGAATSCWPMCRPPSLARPHPARWWTPAPCKTLARPRLATPSASAASRWWTCAARATARWTWCAPPTSWRPTCWAPMRAT